MDDQLITVLGGDAAEYVLDGGEGGRSGYWPRVWAARGLLHAWDDRAAGTDRASTADDAAGRDRAAGNAAATAALIAALSDRAWRVRELAARVIAAHRVGQALDAVAALRDDPVPRVRVAADRAVVLLIATNA